MEAVKNLENQTLLGNIARADLDSRVRKTAINKLIDQNLLVKVAMNREEDKDVRKEAAKKLTDQSFLVKVAKKPDKRISINEKGLDYNALQAKSDELEKEEAEVRIEAVLRIEDQAILAEIAKEKYDSPDVLKAVLNKLEDPRLLAEIAKSDPVYWVCVEIIKKISDQKLLADIVKNGKSIDGRRKAINKLDDFVLLSDLAMNDDSEDIREEAIMRLDDQSLLAEIAKNDKSSYVRLAAIKKLKDRNLLNHISTNDVDSEVRQVTDKILRDLILLDKGLDHPATDSEIQHAVDTRNAALIKAIINSTDRAKDWRTDGGRTLLHVAAELNDEELIKILLDKGADVNAQNEFGMTPLHILSSRLIRIHSYFSSNSFRRRMFFSRFRVSHKNFLVDTPLVCLNFLDLDTPMHRRLRFSVFPARFSPVSSAVAALLPVCRRRGRSSPVGKRFWQRAALYAGRGRPAFPPVESGRGSAWPGRVCERFWAAADIVRPPAKSARSAREHSKRDLHSNVGRADGANPNR